MSAEKLLIPLTEAETLSRNILQDCGVPGEDAALVTESLLLAEESRMPSHGLMRLKPTAARLRQGSVNPRPAIRCEQTAGNILRYDADGALGQVAGNRAMTDCIRIARESGSAFAAIRHAFHFGMMGWYTRRAAREGCLAFVCTNASAQMAAWGGLDRVLGTNPFAVAFPTTGEDAFSLDISTAAAARGKIRLAAREGRELPPGWAMDAQGLDTTNPERALEGTVLPMAGHKGFGLAMTVDLLSAVLTGADLSYEASNMFEGREETNTGCFMAVLDLNRFVPREEYDRRVGDWVGRIRASRPRPGCGGVHIPGDTLNEAERRKPQTIPVSAETWAEVTGLWERRHQKEEKP